VAAGHPATVAAAAEILEDGGNAFDAALAALCAACAAEPVLAGLGGGGFLLARPADGAPRVYDFFTHTPRRRRPEDAVDFHPITVDFGATTQEFHVGLGAAATPGTVRGLFAAHGDLCRLPMARIVEPGARLASQGVVVQPMQAYIFKLVAPILLASPAGRALFAGRGRPDAPLREGETFLWPALADTLETLAREGERLFYEGEIARGIVDACEHHGGQLTADDLRAYTAERRPPLERRFDSARVLTNPAPAAGGLLIGFALDILDVAGLRGAGFGAPRHAALLARTMRLVNRARADSGLAEDPDAAAARLIDPALLAAYRAEVAGAPPGHRGTTHVSVIDRHGNAAALSLSNGEGCGFLRDGDGFMLNNMLGEEDLNPQGAHRWAPDRRMSSMMAPTAAVERDGALTALGSGGSNRIRSAILQVLVNVLTFRLPLADAVEAARLHHERGRLDIEPGWPEGAMRAAAAEAPEHTLWPERNLFFGGVHAVHRGPRGDLAGHGDPRRGGHAAVV
jgi:gamma-glutamyltranspeptidase/glutathione hydrolase